MKIKPSCRRPDMKLPALKQEAYNWYKLLYELTQAYSHFSSPDRDAAFKQEVRGCGDLRRRATWERALCRLKARCVVEVAETGQQLISTYAIRLMQQFPRLDDRHQH